MNDVYLHMYMYIHIYVIIFDYICNCIYIYIVRFIINHNHILYTESFHFHIIFGNE